jgi:hypothetical protein
MLWISASFSVLLLLAVLVVVIALCSCTDKHPEEPAPAPKPHRRPPSLPPPPDGTQPIFERDLDEMSENAGFHVIPDNKGEEIRMTFGMDAYADHDFDESARTTRVEREIRDSGRINAGTLPPPAGGSSSGEDDYNPQSDGSP